MKLVEYIASVVWGDTYVERIARGKEGDTVLLCRNRKAIVLRGFQV